MNEWLDEAMSAPESIVEKSSNTGPPEINGSSGIEGRTPRDKPPFTVKSMLEFCWGLTLTLSDHKAAK